jgi:hypothetical protein
MTPLNKLIGNRNKGVAIKTTPRIKMKSGFLNMAQNY